MPNPVKDIAIIGAGVSGLICAHDLISAGHNVTVFDKSRGVGGRLATRRTEEFMFYHGAASFGASHDAFRAYIDAALQQGHLAETTQQCPFNMTSSPYYASRIGANRAFKHLVAPQNVRLQTHIARIQQDKSRWSLMTDEHCIGTFKHVILAVPAPQAISLLGDLDSDMTSALKGVSYRPFWTLMLGLKTHMEHPDSAINRDVFECVINDDEKKTLTFYTTDEWTRAHLELSKGDARDILLEQLYQANHVKPHDIDIAMAHRWRYGIVQKSLQTPFLKNVGGSLYACGDWALEGGVESAFLSGKALAEEILAMHSPLYRTVNYAASFDVFRCGCMAFTMPV